MAYTAADSLHRLAKEALDSGAASSIADAESMLRRLRLVFEIDASEAHQPWHQAALLSGVAIARRVFLGGVFVEGAVDVPVVLPSIVPMTLGDAVIGQGGLLEAPARDIARVSIGGAQRPRESGFHVRTVCTGWRGGIVPASSKIAPSAVSALPLSGMLAAALAVNEAFLYARNESHAAGRRAIGLSLWCPRRETDWLTHDGSEPTLRYLPSRLWMLGLGHLGQAYLWALGLLPYEHPSQCSLVLQDVDEITPSTESTSILSDANMIGRKKTRAMADWCERRGFTTSIQERLFSADFRRQQSEPGIVLCGVDNGASRRALEQVGFEFVVEAGLGRGYNNFRTMRIHTLPGNRRAAEIWRVGAEDDDVLWRPAYKQMLARSELDRCGVTLLAGKAVGAPFVGSVAACLVVSEVLRLLHGGRQYQLIDLDLQSVEHRLAVPQARDFGNLNPGFTVAA